jgi:hypothetical protein
LSNAAAVNTSGTFGDVLNAFCIMR